MINILVVEDDKAINELESLYLKNEGYNIYSCFNGQEAFEKFKKEKIDFVLTDIMMPVMDGNELADKIRQLDKKVPIVFVTAKDDMLSKKISYRHEIDDYITKPFDIDELVLKVKAILRRIEIQNSNKLIVGNLSLDQEEHSAYLNGEELQLTVREFDILFKLLSYPKKTFTRSQLMEEFWDFDTSSTSRTVDVYMAKLRDKTSKCTGFEIITVHGLGYKLILK